MIKCKVVSTAADAFFFLNFPVALWRYPYHFIYELLPGSAFNFSSLCNYEWKKLLIQTANECKSNSNCNQMSSSNTCQAKQTQRLNDFDPVSTEGAAQ